MLFLYQLFALCQLLPQASLGVSATVVSIRSSDDVPREYLVVDNLFKQDDSDTDDDDFSIYDENFGLEDGVTWEDVLDKLADKNAKSDNTAYKLIFFARHGEGYHNVAPEYYTSEEWTCVEQEKDGNGTVEWYDALLTDNGKKEIEELNQFWKTQILSGAPTPSSFYVSPLRRTLQTFNYTWGDIITYNSSIPIVKEMAREKYGIGTESKRHSKSYIQENYQFANFESGFTEDDELWTSDKHEPLQHARYRAGLLLDDIFVNDTNTVISITTHSGTISAFLKVIGHRKWSTKTGEVVPVMVKASDYGSYETPDLDKAWLTLPAECSATST